MKDKKIMLIQDVFTKELKPFNVATGKPMNEKEIQIIEQIEIYNKNQTKLF